MSTINNAFESQETLFGYSEDDFVSPTYAQKDVYSDINEMASSEALPTYVRQGNVQYSTSALPTSTAGENLYSVDRSSTACPDRAVNFADDEVPLTKELLAIHSIQEQNDGVKIFFSEIRFVNGCLVGVNAEANYPLSWGSIPFAFCGGSIDIAGPPSITEWDSAL